MLLKLSVLDLVKRGVGQEFLLVHHRLTASNVGGYSSPRVKTFKARPNQTFHCIKMVFHELQM